LFPELDSIITLDVDIIVLRDLYSLQQSSLKSYLVAGAAEGQKVKDHSLCKFPYEYINVGVMSQNLKLMREINGADIILIKYQKIKSSESFRCLILPEQDVLNISFKNKIKFVSKRWNYIPSLGFNTKFMPFIIHYAGMKNVGYNDFYNKPSFRHLNLTSIKYKEFAKAMELKNSFK
jgi:lipopolysaccharide biosynthesis glycosyltransferase